MAVKLGDAFVALGTKDELDKGLNAARVKVNGWLSNITQGVAQGIGQAVAGAIGNTIRFAFSEIDKSIKAASGLNETISKTNAVFRDNSKDILAWSGTTSKAFGLTQQGALEAASGLGNMFKQLGGGLDDAADFSKGLITLAGDLVAFHNVAGGTEEVLQDIQSAFRGEFDPIQKYIPIINAAAVEQQALAESGKESAKQLTALDKAMATQTLIVRGMGDAYGAAAREIDSAASQQRIFDARMAESAARIGQVFLPVQQAIFRGLNLLIDTVAPYGENIMDSLAAGLARGIVSILPVLQQVRALFTYWLKPGSPPRLLKELTEWGSGAMQAYLEGWGQADFGALTSLGGVFESALRSFAGSGGIKETDLVSRVFGTQKALAQAIREWRSLGAVTEGTFAAIDQAAGPAGGAVSRLAREYFELQRATRNVTDAQNELNDITDEYARALDPISQQLDAVRAKQQELRDNQRLEELGKIIADPRADADDRQLARLEAEEIQLERQASALEKERDAAVDGAQDKIDAAKKEEAAQQQKFDTAQAVLDQQTKTNSLIAEETTLRQHLIDEGLAEQKRVMDELEAAQRKATAEAERTADAQLRYNLASTDTAGQLEIMRGELAKTVTGSADYFDILTQIIGLEERLKKERDSAGGGLLAPLVDAVAPGGDVEKASKGIQALSDALDEAFKALSGGDGKTVELAPAWQGFADTLGTIGQAAKEAAPLVQSFIDLVMGKDVEGAQGTDPFGDNWWLAGIIPGMQNIISLLGKLRDGDWASVWGDIQQYVFDTINTVDPEADARTFGFYAWLQDIVIPAINAFAAGDWKSAFTLLATPINDLINSAFTNGFDFIKEFARGIAEGLLVIPFGIADLFRGALGMDDPFAPKPINPNKQRIDPSTLPQSYGGIPGIEPLVPAMAGASSVTNGPSIVNQYWINQNIGLGEDIGGARQGALMGLRELIIDRRLSG